MEGSGSVQIITNPEPGAQNTYINSMDPDRTGYQVYLQVLFS